MINLSDYPTEQLDNLYKVLVRDNSQDSELLESIEKEVKNRVTKLTDKQKEFIWLLGVDKLKYGEIAKRIDVPIETIREWEKSFREDWKHLSEIKAIYSIKKIKTDFKEFYEWHLKMQLEKKCFYCGINESKIETLINKGLLKTKRLVTRGRTLELDRKEPDLPYDRTDNIVYACYWCNNAKTDTFSSDEFKDVGKIFGNIWKKRLLK